MTPQEQRELRIAIAGHDGWRHEVLEPVDPEKVWIFPSELPNYPEDLNAILELARKIPADLFPVWSQHLVTIVIRDNGTCPEGNIDITDVYTPVEMCGAVAKATALQHCEAYILTYNLKPTNG